MPQPSLMRRRGAARSGGCALRFSASRRRSRTSCGAWPSSSASWRRRGPRSLPVSRRRSMTEIEPAMPSPEEVHEFFAGLGIKHIPNLDKQSTVSQTARSEKRGAKGEVCAPPRAPGAVQGDLVLHCGESTEGFHLSNLVVVDVASGWIELEPIWGVGAVRVGAGVEHIHRRLPVPLREWHTDNGSEFVNGALLRYCRRHGIRVTRDRQYRKNDQAWVELRNLLAVRRLVGRDRYSSHVAFGLLQRLYALLRVQLNFFRPFRKVLHTRRVGSQRVRRYDAAQTPLSALASHRKPLRRAARCARGRVSRRRSRTACHPNWRYSRAALEVWRPAANSRISG